MDNDQTQMHRRVQRKIAGRVLENVDPSNTTIRYCRRKQCSNSRNREWYKLSLFGQYRFRTNFVSSAIYLA